MAGKEETAPRVDTVRLQRMVRAYRESAALMAAIELGLFTWIERGADTLEKLSAALKISITNVERLVTVCVALQLVERGGTQSAGVPAKAAGAAGDAPDGAHGETKLRNAPDVARFLVEGKPHYAGPWMLFTKPDWERWGRLAEFVSTAEPPSRLGRYADFSVESARKYHEATYSIGLGAGRRFARQVDLSGRKKLLDLGGGSGAYCIAAAQAYPELSAVVFDLPPVCEVAREFIAEHGLSERISAEGGDFTADPFPMDADVVVMASNLPIYSREIIQQVIGKAFEALLPGGEMHLVGEMLNAERSGPVDPALWGLSEAIDNTTGLAHSVSDCTGYFDHAGFEQVAVHEFVPGTLNRVAGTKPK